MDSTYLLGPTPRAFAHRGGTETGAENTLEAFAHAYELGYRYLETDVHLTTDGRVVSFHDEQLDRMTDRRGEIAELTWDEVRRARVGGSGQVPLMAELLETFPDARFNIDVKVDAVVGPLIELLETRSALDRVGIGCFSRARLGRVRDLVPDVPTVLTSLEVVRLVAEGRGVKLPLDLPGEMAQVPIRTRRLTIVTPQFVEAAHRRGIEVHVWTVDDAAVMHRLFDMGVDGIMTDRPSVLRAVLVERGLWHEPDR